MWEVGDSVCMVDLSKSDIDLAIRIAYAVQRDLERRDACGDVGQGPSASADR